MNDSKQSEHAWTRLSAPAKINLMLSVHGRRADGFHELTSVVMPLEFGDELELRANGLEADSLTCDGAVVPLDESNLVLRAAQAFRAASGRGECFDFRLRKRIPVGAGLGGGSSDAVAALKGMNALLGTGMGADELRAVAAALGSDCPFFVDAVPAVMRGRGELLEPLDPAAAERLCGQAVVLFRPPFGIDTARAYRQLAAQPELYAGKASAEARLRAFSGGGDVGDLLHNVFEDVVGQKFLALPCLLEKLRAQGHRCMMSGSGSTCFALMEDDPEAEAIQQVCQNSWGQSIFWIKTLLSQPEI